MAGLLGRMLRRRKREEIACAAVVPAAGSSTRMAGRGEILEPLGDRPVLAHTLLALEGSPLINEIVVVTREDLILPVGQLCRQYGLAKVRKVVVGGATRAHSVLAGVLEVEEGARLIAVHDGARPLVSRRVIEAAIRRAAACGAAAPAVPVKDTLKQAKNGVVTATPERSSLFAVQTPQVFEADLLRAGLERALRDGAAVTDDCSAVERLGVPVALTEGSYANLKITTPEDLAMAAALLDMGAE